MKRNEAARCEGAVESTAPHFKGSPYAPDVYPRTRQMPSTSESFELWDLDPLELVWLLANQQQVLTDELRTVPVSTGGMRVAGIREGSFASLRGIRVGDIVLDINGQRLDGPRDVEDLIEDPAYSGAKGWRLSLLRGGRAFTIDYRHSASFPTARSDH